MCLSEINLNVSRETFKNEGLGYNNPKNTQKNLQVNDIKTCRRIDEGVKVYKG